MPDGRVDVRALTERLLQKEVGGLVKGRGFVGSEVGELHQCKDVMQVGLDILMEGEYWRNFVLGSPKYGEDDDEGGTFEEAIGEIDLDNECEDEDDGDHDGDNEFDVSAA